MAEIVQHPSKALPAQFSGKDVWAAPEPNDRQTWGACQYMRKTCMGCPAWEDGKRGKSKRGCRALAEECARGVMFYATKETP